ncbi:GNAT family N-acetyltransferase [Tractidigestivibacter sp.]|uniref:GNAT family N-acetyltransferase n=1 Tax=Tractidigestivibacter sp. TaxID=2847320 RepID=UPI002A90E136|nr:GNAT family N-acetyltransferase [Tractidigestivibacter sp.]MDY5272271.1 GNAT family N-acetyltransferase [Tractidigestivibacter sp.]
MRSPTTLTTARLSMRPWREGDAGALYRYASDPEVGPRAGWAPHQSPEESREVLRDILMVPDSWAITLRHREGALADEPVGAIALRRVEPHDAAGTPAGEAEIGYWIARPWWGRGYMTEAVREVLRHAFLVEGLGAVRAGYYEGNVGSSRVQKKAGLRPHHRVEGAVDRCGVTHTEHVQRITREEWEVSLNADPTDAGTIARQQSEAACIIDALPLVSFVRSGGQTGADRGGLDAAREMGVPICGWCPPGGLAEDLPKPPGLLALYPELREGPSAGYVERTAWNVRDSHATLIVSPGGLEPRSGTEMTAIFAERMGRPVLVLEGGSVDENAAEALAWLRSLRTGGMTLNVAGPRESKMPGVHGLTHDIVAAILDEAGRRSACLIDGGAGRP